MVVEGIIGTLCLFITTIIGYGMFELDLQGVAMLMIAAVFAYTGIVICIFSMGIGISGIVACIYNANTVIHVLLAAIFLD